MITSMDVGRLENEQKELKLRNQSLQLENMASELEQKRLGEEALQLNLKNKEVELQNAAVRLQNDSLDKHNKNLQISEYESKMAAQEQAARARRIFTTSAIAIAALIILALAYILWRRSQNARRLRRMNEQLQEANTNLKTAYDQLEETTTAKERMESELRIARDIQMGMVPSRFPQHDHFDIYGILKPAKEVGGDLYDFFIQNNRLYFCIGDVSGKGIPASLFMSVIVNLFRMVAKEGFPPEYIATRLNETVSENNENGMFCTMFIGEIDVQSGKLLYCNAGHNPPVMMARRLNSTTPTAPVFVEMEANAPIGLWPNLVFKGEVIEHIKGRPLFLYTDGLSEAEDGEQLQFGDDRILDVIASQPFTGARQMVERLSESVRQHVGDAPQSDDLTMLCIMCS
jgi:serine phosphatase RsbU (regulator of sigma subunit)